MRLPAADRTLPKALPRGDYVRISVADTGEGMSEATLAKAMEPFFTTKGIGKGTGLGLSMVHGLTAQSGGAMHITSQLGKERLINSGCLGRREDVLEQRRRCLRSPSRRDHKPRVENLACG